MHIIGVGARQDSSNATGATFVGNFYLKSGASGGSIEGIRINGYVLITEPVASFSISRCITETIYGDSSASNFNIRECLIGGLQAPPGYYGFTSLKLLGTNNVINNCYFHGQVFLNTSEIGNSIFNLSSLILGTLNLMHCNIRNCILNTNALTSLTNCMISNSINFDNGFFNSNQGINNICCIPNNINALFVNVGNLGWNNEMTDFHLAPGSPYLTAGTNGTQIGIYGGAYPMKMGMVPSNPHITNAIVAPQTNNNGQLQINITTRAEQQ